MPRLLFVTKTGNGGYKAVFTVENANVFSFGALEKRVVFFGAGAGPTYTTTPRLSNRSRMHFIRRATENQERMKQSAQWTEPMHPDTLVRYILWEHRGLARAVTMYRRRFGV